MLAKKSKTLRFDASLCIAHLFPLKESVVVIYGLLTQCAPRAGGMGRRRVKYDGFRYNNFQTLHR